MHENQIIERKYHSIVVGGGIAGLTAATYLAKSGQKVLLVEKNKELGGLVNSFSHNGFHFEAGVRALEDAGIIFPMLKQLGIELEVVKSKVSIGIENQIIDINTESDLLKYQELLNNLFPESKEDIKKLIGVISKIIKQMEVLYGIENPLFKDLKQDRKYLFKTLLPWLPKFLLTVGKINKMNMPVEDFLKTIVKDVSLRDMISQHFFKNTPTFFALSYFSLYLDYFYPKGGVGKLSEALHNKALEFGAEIMSETQIVSVDADNYTVSDNNNNFYQYENLVWAADLKNFYTILQADNFSKKTKQKIKTTSTNMLEKRGSDSVFSLFLEVDEPLESFQKISYGHFFYTPSKCGLASTNRKERDEILNNFDNLSKEQIFAWLDKFTALNTFEISIPGLKDASLVPCGKTGIIISLLAEYDLFAKVKAAGWLEEFTKQLQKRMIDVMSDSVFPMLKKKIIDSFSFSPLSIERRIGSSEGAIVGWAFEKNMPVVNKIQFSDRSVYTPIDNIYQVGQWAYSPAGVPMSILTAKIAADKIIKKKH